MTKEKFVELINFIDMKRQQENEFCGMLERMCPEEYVNAFLYSEYETQVVELIKEIFGISDDDDILEYFLYDLEFGRDYREDVCDFDLSDAGKLYDYLTTRENK